MVVKFPPFFLFQYAKKEFCYLFATQRLWNKTQWPARAISFHFKGTHIFYFTAAICFDFHDCVDRFRLFKWAWTSLPLLLFFFAGRSIFMHTPPPKKKNGRNPWPLKCLSTTFEEKNFLKRECPCWYLLAGPTIQLAHATTYSSIHFVLCVHIY